MVTSLKTREKKKLIDSLLAGDHALIHLGPQEPGVTLPVHLMSNHTVTLKLSRHFRGTLILHADHIETHLLFGQAYFQCRIPYEAIWGVTSENGETTSWLEGFVDSGSAPARQTPFPITAPAPKASSLSSGEDASISPTDGTGGRKNSSRPHLSLHKSENSSGTAEFEEECPEDSEEHEVDEQSERDEPSESTATKARPKLVRIK